jgi:hypothetical protein
MRRMMVSAGRWWRRRRWKLVGGACTGIGHFEIRLTNPNFLRNARPLQGEPLSMRPISGCLWVAHSFKKSMSLVLRGCKPGTKESEINPTW